MPLLLQWQEQLLALKCAAEGQILLSSNICCRVWNTNQLVVCQLMDLAIHTPVPYGSVNWAVLKRSLSSAKESSISVWAVVLAVLYLSKWGKNQFGIGPSGDLCIAQVLREFCHTIHPFLALDNGVLANSQVSMSLMVWLANSQFNNMNELPAGSNNA